MMVAANRRAASSSLRASSWAAECSSPLELAVISFPFITIDKSDGTQVTFSEKGINAMFDAKYSETGYCVVHSET